MSFNYHLESINERLELLLTVLQYDSEETKYFSIAERILINQERAAMMDFKNYLFGNIELTEVRMYVVSETIEKKIKAISEYIIKRNWEPNQNQSH